MPRIVKIFSDGSRVEFDRGRFDNWCVYFKPSNDSRKAPSDIEYFRELQALSAIYGANRVYQDFVRVYDGTQSEVSTDTLGLIEELSAHYRNDTLRVQKVFTIVYAAMVAEQNKQFTKLGKRVKRLGIYQVIIENMDVAMAATYSKDKKWRDVDGECTKRGF